MTVIKAIETRYKGYRFRSRLEARWAVFFDHLGVKWEYEKEGFDLGEHGCYLPDFWLPDLDMWVEIKGDDISKTDSAKCFALVKQTNKTVAVLCGSIPENTDDLRDDFYVIDAYENPHLADDHPERFGVGWDNYHGWVQCEQCGKIKYVFSQYAGRGCRCSGHEKRSGRTDLLDSAYAAARSARFEHGESG